MSSDNNNENNEKLPQREPGKAKEERDQEEKNASIAGEHIPAQRRPSGS